MKAKRRKILAGALAILMVMSVPVFGSLLPDDVPGAGNGVAYGAIGSATVSATGDTSAMQGDTAYIEFTVKNNSNSNMTFDKAELLFSPASDVTVSGSIGSITLGASGSSTDTTQISFNAKIAKNADTGSRSIALKLYNGATSLGESKDFGFSITESLATPSSDSGNYVAAADINHSISPSEGFSTGDGNSIAFTIYNNGNTLIKNARATLSLPDGLSFYNSSNSVDLGYISTGAKKNVSFPIAVDDTAESKNYAVTLTVTGLSSNNSEAKIEKTFYVPVIGGTASLSAKNISIQGVSIPSTVTSGKDFNLTFNVKNIGSATAKNMKVYVELPEGLMNKTTTTFVENSLAAGNTKSYSVTLFSNTGGTTYPVKIAVAPLGGTETEDVLQYVSVYVAGDGSNAKTPQLMIETYSYGGSSVQAGSTCVLHLGLLNTSAKELTNIKVSLKSDDGVFVPVGSSNSFFIESIPAKGYYEKSIMLSVKAAAEQGTSTINVVMNYEDGAGNAYTPEDIIAIPVTQSTRLSVDDIVAPMECYVGEMSSAELDFYNMGKAALNNVRINATGNFDTYESNSYYAGNMASGASDNYSFSFVPREVGTMEGTVTFTYENADGGEETYDVPFAFEVMEAPVWDEEGMYPEEEGGGVPWSLIITGIVIVLLAAGFIIWRKLRKAKLHKELSLADEEFMNSMDLKDEDVEKDE